MPCLRLGCPAALLHRIVRALNQYSFLVDRAMFWKIQRFPAATQNWKSPTSWGYYVDIICWRCLVRYPQAFNPEFWYAYNRNPQAPILLFNINEDGSAYENPTNFDDSFDEIDDGGHRGLELCVIGLLARGHAFCLIQPNLKVGNSQPSMFCRDANKGESVTDGQAKYVPISTRKLILTSSWLLIVK